MHENEYLPSKWQMRESPSGPVVKNLPCNAGGAGLIPGWVTKILYAMEQLKAHVPQLEPAHSRAHMPQLESPHATVTEACAPWSPCTTRACVPQLENPCAAMKEPT